MVRSERHSPSSRLAIFLPCEHNCAPFKAGLFYLAQYGAYFIFNRHGTSVYPARGITGKEYGTSDGRFGCNTVRLRIFGENFIRVETRNFASLQELSVCILYYPNRIGFGCVIDEVLGACRSLDRSSLHRFIAWSLSLVAPPAGLAMGMD